MGSYWAQESTHRATEQRPEMPRHWERRGLNSGPEKQWRERWKRESGAWGARHVCGSNQRPGMLQPQGRTRSMQHAGHWHVVAGTAKRCAGASVTCVQLPAVHHPAPLLSPPPSPSSFSTTSFPAATTSFIVSLCSAPVLLLSVLSVYLTNGQTRPFSARVYCTYMCMCHRDIVCRVGA